MTATQAKQDWKVSVRSSQRGMTLLELLVAMVIGAVLIFGATQVYVDSRNTYTINETVARMQETARYAISVIEPDVRMANYWGLNTGADSLQGNNTAVSGGGTANTMCGANYDTNLTANISGTNDSYTLPGTCDAKYSGAMPNADTLTVRRASSATSVTSTNMPAAGPLRICSTRGGGSIITDSSTCGTAPVAQLNDLIVNAYYVNKDSDQQTGLPSLRRKALIYDTTAGAPKFQDQEVTPNIEDMQIQYGVDTSGGFGANAGAATEYLDDPSLIPSTAQVVSVRITLLVRADAIEVGFTDTKTYAYGDRLAANGTTNDLTSTADKTKAYQPTGTAAQYRRLLITRTIQIRNVLGS